MTGAFVLDPLDVRRAHVAPGPLRAFNDASVLAAADVHVARRIAQLADVDDDLVTLAAAFAVRGPRLGHVCVDLATIHRTATVDTEEAVDLTVLPWPDPAAWVARVAASPLVSDGAPTQDPRPLRLDGTALYLDRYWREESAVAADVQTLAAGPTDRVQVEVLADGLQRLFPRAEAGDRQRLAAGAAVLSRFAVVAGGPGTGKTTTVARIVALLLEQAEAAGEPWPEVGLATPTNTAAARLTAAVRRETRDLRTSDAVKARLDGLEARTLHRLLGWKPGSHSRFRHDRDNRLPYDVVIVDETSMVSLTLMARLIEAVRPAARLVLVGDPGQLTSIEAGAVLGDIVGPTQGRLRMSDTARGRLGAALDEPVDADPGPAVGDGIVVLERVHRHGQAIGDVAEPIRRGDADAVIAALSRDVPEVTWLRTDVGDPAADLGPIRDGVVAAATRTVDAARAHDAAAAVRALGAHRILCAHRRGPYGVETWVARIEGWLGEAIDGFGAEGRWYVGRPLLVTENDHALRIFNGDTGVIVAAEPGRVSAAFGDREIRPARLPMVQTAYAMTIHKSQGSQFGTAVVLLPDPTSPILTRELLYTAVTRSQDHLVIAGTEEAIRAAVDRPIARSSGLRARLWDA